MLCSTVTSTSSPLRPDLWTTSRTVDRRVASRSSSSGAPNVMSDAANIRRGKLIGGRKPPRLGWPSGPIWSAAGHRQEKGPVGERGLDPIYIQCLADRGGETNHCLTVQQFSAALTLADPCPPMIDLGLRHAHATNPSSCSRPIAPLSSPALRPTPDRCARPDAPPGRRGRGLPRPVSRRGRTWDRSGRSGGSASRTGIGGEQPRIGRYRLMQRLIHPPGHAARVEGGLQGVCGARGEGGVEQGEEPGAVDEARAFVPGETQPQSRLDRRDGVAQIQRRLSRPLHWRG
jgi:hypothetical protein